MSQHNKRHVGTRYGSQHIVGNRDVAEFVIHHSDRGYKIPVISLKVQEKFQLVRPPSRHTIARILRRWGEPLSGGRWRMKSA